MPKMILSGTIVSDINDKTVVVKVVRCVLHPIYSKAVTLSKKYHAHDEENACKIGDKVSIEECAPVSKKKKWKVINHDSKRN